MNATFPFPFFNEQDAQTQSTAPPRLARRQFLKHAAQGVAAVSLAGLARTASFAGESATTAKPALRPTGLVFDEICKTHETGLEAPECPQRYDAVLQALSNNNLLTSL